MSLRSVARPAYRTLPRLTVGARIGFGLAAATAVVGVLYLNAAAHIVVPQLTDPVGPRAFPYLLGAGLLVCAAVLFVEGLVALRGNDDAAIALDVRARIAGGVMGWTLAYVLAFQPLGYILATALFLFGLIFVFDGRRLVRSAVVAVGFAAASYVAFNDALDVFLPAPFFLR